MREIYKHQDNMNTGIIKGTVDGYTENLKIQGASIENIVNDPKEEFNGIPANMQIQIKYDTSKIEQGESEWTLFFNITNTTFEQGEFDRLTVGIYTMGGLNRLTQYYPVSEGMGKIVKNITINPPLGSDINATKIIFYSEVPGKQITVKDVMLVKGTYHSWIDYFKGTSGLGPYIDILSVKVEDTPDPPPNPIIRPIIERGTINNITGSPEDNGYSIRTEFISTDFITNNYLLEYNNELVYGGQTRIYCYDEHKTLLNWSSLINESNIDLNREVYSKGYDVDPRKVKYIRFVFFTPMTPQDKLLEGINCTILKTQTNAKLIPTTFKKGGFNVMNPSIFMDHLPSISSTPLIPIDPSKYYYMMFFNSTDGITQGMINCWTDDDRYMGIGFRSGFYDHINALKPSMTKVSLQFQYSGSDVPGVISRLNFELYQFPKAKKYNPPRIVTEDYDYKTIKLPRELYQGEELAYDKEYNRCVIRRSDNKQVLELTDIYQPYFETFRANTWFTVVDSHNLTGSISFDYPTDPDYAHTQDHRMFVLESGDIIDLSLYRTIDNQEKKGYFKLTDGLYGTPTKYVAISEIVRIINNK